MKKIRTFTFILNPVTSELHFPLELIPEHVLIRAGEEEVKEVKQFLFQGGFNQVFQYAYGDVDSNGNRLAPERKTWKFFGIESETNCQAQLLQFAGNLLENEISIGPSFLSIQNDKGIWEYGVSGYSDYSFFFGNPTPDLPILHLTRPALSSWNNLYQQLFGLQAEDITPFRSFDSLKRIPLDSPLKVLGMFSIIESILAHKPHDHYDSLSHQVSTKMVLLSKRFNGPLTNSFFQCDAEKTWKKLYDYRSCVAHGVKPDFKGTLQVLGDKDKADEFVWASLKHLLRHLLVEPDLIADLKRC